MILQLHTQRGWGGGEYQVLHLVSGLIGAGISTTLRARPDGLLWSRATELGLPAAPLVGPWRVPLGEIPLSRELAEAGVTLIHCHDSSALSLGIRLKRRLHVPLVLARRVASPLRVNPWSRRKYSPRQIDAVIAVSETVRVVFCASGFPRERVFVAQSGLDMNELDRADPERPFRRPDGARLVIAGIGKLAPKKNWRLLIHTAAALARQGVAADWVLVGDGPDRRALESLARDVGVADRIQFMGYRRDAERVLHDCDLLFFPSVREGAGLTVRQAMALGVPVVAVDAAGTMETLDGHGWLVSSDDVDGAARAVREALGDADKREAVRQAARTSARTRFTIERTVRETNRVYEMLLGRRA